MEEKKEEIITECEEIVAYPNSVLRCKAKPISEITEKESELFEKMFVTMKNSKGVGLAAPQIGVSLQMIVANVGQDIVKLANPVILKKKGREVMSEGCLSVPGMSIDVKRAKEVTVGAMDSNGDIVQLRATGLMARVLQHEIDHINGKLIVDYLNLFEKIKLYFKLKIRKKKPRMHTD